MSKRKTPILRFKGFNNDWEQRKLGDIVSTYSGGTPSANNKKYYNGDIPFIRSAEINKNKTELFITKDALHNSAAKIVDIGDILYALYGATSGEVAISKINGAINQAILVIKPKQNFDSQFITYWLKNSKNKIIHKYLQGGQGNLFIKIPNYREQKILGIFFQKIEKYIFLQERKYEELKLLKKALMQNMFADKAPYPNLRFNNFTAEWKQYKLGKIAKIVRGASPRPIKSKKWFDNKSKVGWIRISDVTKQGGRIKKLEQHLSKKGQEKTRVIITPHLLLSIAASVGYPVINYIPTGVHDGFLIFKDTKFNLNYMFYWLDNYKPQWQKFGQPGSQVNLNRDIVANTIIFLPIIDEQRTIANVFYKIDKCISLQNEIIIDLKKSKKFLLQNMFI